MVLYNRLRHSPKYRESAKEYKKELAGRTAANLKRSRQGGRRRHGSSSTTSKAPPGPRKGKRTSVTAPSGHASARVASSRVAAANARSAAASNTQWRVIESPRILPTFAAADMARVNIGNKHDVALNHRHVQKRPFESKLPKGPKLIPATTSVENFGVARCGGGPRARRLNASSASDVHAAKSAAVPRGTLARPVW